METLAWLLSAFLALLLTISTPGPLGSALLCSWVNCVCPYCLAIIVHILQRIVRERNALVKSEAEKQYVREEKRKKKFLVLK